MITALSEALAERGFTSLTPVQEAVTEPDLVEADLLVSAQTGSGKTVGFGLAIAPTLLDGAETFGPVATPLALIVAPTRELAFQVMQELRWLYARTGAVVTSCVGGMDVRQERRALERGAHIVVGTPGRLSDHIRRGSLDLSAVRAAVLDEADEMLDLGFREDLEFILGAAPVERRTLMFSATVSPMIAKLAQQFQRDAKRISTINKAEQHADIAYNALRVAASDSDHAIFNLLRFHDDQSAIVFANTRVAVSHLSARLANRGLKVVTLSGELSQTERSHALQAMRDGRARVCVATDVAARGIDLPNLTLVIHADLPTNPESLLHRSGRTGRAGRKGISALIVPPKMIKRAERLLASAKITAEWTVPPSADEILRRDEERLLSDPAWRDPITDEEMVFADKLLARYGAEAVAAAFLRLHQSRHAAPEDLSPPDTTPSRDHAAFGPSRWFALSVGRAERAEPRWLLPLLRRSADLPRAAIGAIRMQQDETYVEIAEASVAKFQASLGPGGLVSDGIRARLLDGPPDLSRHTPRPQESRAPVARDTKDGKPAPAKKAPYIPKPAIPSLDKDKADRPKAKVAKQPAWTPDDGAEPAMPAHEAGQKKRASKKPGYNPKQGQKPGQKPGKKPVGASKNSAGKAGQKGQPATAPTGAAGKGGKRGAGKPGPAHQGGQRPPRRGKT